MGTVKDYPNLGGSIIGTPLSHIEPFSLVLAVGVPQTVIFATPFIGRYEISYDCFDSTSRSGALAVIYIDPATRLAGSFTVVSDVDCTFTGRAIN